MYPWKWGNFCKYALAEVENMKMEDGIVALKERCHADNNRGREGKS